MRILSHQTKFTDEALLGLRVLLGGIFLWHGIPKVLDVASSTAAFEGLGLPGMLGPIVGVLEIVCAVLVLLGILTPVATLGIGGIIVVAIGLVHAPNGEIAAALERDVLILGATIMLYTAGPGRYALKSATTADTSVGETADG